ncbi:MULTISPECIES: hypothetical protein [Stenotrophomonas]|uniref:Glycosyltransferase n=1 Tax=Stenotrophomonas lactitubi TaxID=2045214 RepID=A0AAW4GEG7_9GAMM|nr:MULTISPECIES: hypothetical protein [Stenotrophomonas]MBM9913267.1 hypothetical protein [Stenotrophomonas lactitubi]MBM9923153.1 hypothetical protein [Stenotrophomonas lactitubi]MBM9939136.1 hypothetical protein [Stenotrophomonas lactitubi]
MDARIESIAWAIQSPSRKVETRPARLVHELTLLDVVAKPAAHQFHGRGETSERNENRGRWHPVPRAGAKNVAVLSPVFQGWSREDVVWADFYDDWSIAPDINLWHRLLATMTYSRIRQGGARGVVVTCNTPYMAAKLGLGPESVVANGVDCTIAHLPSGGDDRRRLIVLGHLFKGRTDIELLRSALLEWPFDDIVIGAPGTDPAVLGILDASISANRPVRTFAWLSSEELAMMTGVRTVGLVPHVVTDYTLSQDLMKVYQLLALGIKVICPRLLWPNGIDDSMAFLHGIGSDPGAVDDWNNAMSISPARRLDFVASHSWKSRASKIAQLITQGAYA